MTTIQFASALKLLARAYDIRVHDEPCATTSFEVNAATDEHTQHFLLLSAEDTDGLQFDWKFLECDNAEVTVSGDLMTLVAEGDDLNDPEALQIKLMVPLVLEVPVDEVHKRQCQLESHLNFILQHVRDAEKVGRGSFDERRDEVKRHTRLAKEAFDWLDNFTVSRLPAFQETPPVILKALKHVRAHFPEVDRVVFWGDGRWTFLCHDQKFGKHIDTSLLEEAANEVADGYPHAFQLPPEEA